MSKSLSRGLYLLSIIVGIVGGLLLLWSYQGSAVNANGEVTSIGSPLPFALAVILLVVAAIMSFVAWVGALIRMAQLGRWGWFVFLLILSGITMLLYIFWGPKTRAHESLRMPAPYGD